MKKHNKTTLKKFVKDAIALIERWGFTKFPEDEPGYDANSRKRRIMTDLGTYVVHMPEEDTPCSVVDINGYFEDAKQAACVVDSNPFSGKWNTLGFDPDSVIHEFDAKMQLVHARPPTPTEVEAWAVLDAERAAYWSKMRAAI